MNRLKKAFKYIKINEKVNAREDLPRILLLLLHENYPRINPTVSFESILFPKISDSAGGLIQIFVNYI